MLGKKKIEKRKQYDKGKKSICIYHHYRLPVPRISDDQYHDLFGYDELSEKHRGHLGDILGKDFIAYSGKNTGYSRIAVSNRDYLPRIDRLCSCFLCQAI